ncbi:hypothetical protein [Paenibacillus psychroresistens]|uniref:hypothetical protein n=1 Tax=Paenibacillus psychroresistens TaxID=1778678 RepID=UPI001D059533|nr:hypothetical protein [Paenibacillus psychroresistens]
MRLIRKISDSDFLGEAPVWINLVSRFASRGVLVDEQLNVVMMLRSFMSWDT